MGLQISSRKTAQFDEVLAVWLGVNEAIVLQQIWDEVEVSGEMHEGRKWIRRSKKEFSAQFPYWSFKTSQRVIDKLMRAGLLITANLNEDTFDQTLWYSIDKNMLEAILLAADKRESEV